MKRNMVGFMALAGLATSVFGQAPDCRSLQPDRCEFKYGIAFGVEMSVSTSVPWGDRGNPLRRSLSWAAAGVAGGGAQTVCDPAALAEGVFQSKTSASAFCATTVIGFGSQLSQADPTNPVNITQTLTSSYETGLVLFRRPVQTGPFQLECLDSGELICASSAGGVAAGGAAVSVIYDDLSGLPPVGQPLVVRTATIGYSLAIFTGIQGGASSQSASTTRPVMALQQVRYLAGSMPIHTDTLVDGMRLRVVDGVHELIATPRWSTSSFQPMVNLVSPNLLNVVLLPTEDQLSILRAAGTQSATSIDYFSRTIVVTEGMIADANLFDSVDGSPSAVSNWADRIRLGTFSGESVASNPAAAIADWNFDGIVDSVDVQDILPLLDAADLAADVDGSDFVDADDFIAFIAELTNGCRAPGLDGNGANSACLFGADVDASGFVDSDDLVYFVSRVFTS